MTFRLYDKTDDKADLVIFDCIDIRIRMHFGIKILIQIIYNFNNEIKTDERIYDYPYYKAYIETRIE